MWRHTISALFSSVTTTLPHVTDWRTVLPSALMREGGFHHGVDAGKSTIATDRILTISLNTSLIFFGTFVSRVTFARIYARNGDDSREKRDEINPQWLTVALGVCSATQPVINSPKSKANVWTVSVWQCVLTCGGFFIFLDNFLNGNGDVAIL